VAHLLEEIALGDRQPELAAEVTELALAYNFVTPYTAFLAIPASELGDQASTVAAARERKRKILANHPDVEALDGKDRPARFAAFAPSARDEAGGDEESYVEGSPTLARRSHGCAGCASSGGAAPGLLALALVTLVLRRRRRR